MNDELLQSEIRRARELQESSERAHEALHTALQLARQSCRDTLQACSIATLAPLTETDEAIIAALSMRARELLARLG